MKKILAISNSFGVDATRYLYQISRSMGEEVKVVTLYIGGCSLERHFENMKNDLCAYEVYLNGYSSGFFVSLKQALTSDSWNVVTFQQCSPSSGDESSYFPYLSQLNDYVKQLAPNAKRYIHMTWCYPEGSSMFAYTKFSAREEMIKEIEKCYLIAQEKIQANGVIPSLYAMNELYDTFGKRAYADDLHASLALGRYTLSCVWFSVIFERSCLNNTFCDLDEAIMEKDRKTACEIAERAVKKAGYTFVN